MRKSFLLVLLTALLVFGLVASASAQDADTPEYAQKLKAVGIIEGDEGGLRLDDTITRAEFATMTVRALGFGRYAAATTQFSDVTATNHWAGGYINVAAGQKIINGYPDGTFRPDQNVTYNEAITMLVRMLGYGPACPEENWPVSYLAKAAQLGVTSGVTFDAGTAATRGDVFQMLENSIDIDMMEQTGYGDDVRYEEVDKTILNDYLDYDEIEGTVVNIARVDEDLDDNEFEIAVTEVNGEEQDADEEEYTLLAGSPAALFGMDVKAWVNSDDEVVWITSTTDADDIKLDTISAIDEDELTLYVEDEDYDLDEDVVIYLNDESADIDDINDELVNGVYGVVILNDKGDVRFMNVFVSDFSGVVTAVDGTKIEYFEDDGDESTLDLDDYDGYYIANKYGQALDLENIEEDVVIYCRENDDDELFVTVVAEKVEGELEKVKNGSITVGGDSYDVSRAATASDNLDDDISTYLDGNDIGDAITNLAGEKVEVLLDINGEVRHVRGDAEATSGEQYGLVTDAYRSGTDRMIEIFNSEGEDVAYPVEEADNWDKFNTYFEDNDDFIPVVYELNNDGEIAEGTLLVVATEGYFDQYLTGVKLLDAMTFDDDDDYIEDTEEGYFYIDDSTVLMKFDGDDDEDLVVWGNIEDKVATGVKAYVVGDSGKNADFVVFFENYTNISEEEDLYGVVTNAPYYDGDDWIVTINAYGEGELDYIVASENRTDFGEGTLLTFNVDASGEIDDDYTVREHVYREEIEDVDGNSIKFDGDDTYYRVAADAVIYELDEDGDIDDELSRSDLSEDDIVVCIIDSNLIKAMILVNEMYEEAGDGGGDTTTDVVTADYDGDNDKLTITVDTEELDDAYAVRVYDLDTGDPLGGFEVLDANGEAVISNVASDPVFVTVKVYDDNVDVIEEVNVATK